MQVHEGIMCSAAYAYSRENHIWCMIFIKAGAYVDMTDTNQLVDLMEVPFAIYEARPGSEKAPDHFFDVPVDR